MAPTAAPFDVVIACQPRGCQQRPRQLLTGRHITSAPELGRWRGML